MQKINDLHTLVTEVIVTRSKLCLVTDMQFLRTSCLV